MSYVAKRKDGSILTKGEEIRTFRDDQWIFQSVTHPRKIYVIWDEDPDGEPFWPNRSSMEFYANVFDLGIWDEERQEWTFKPGWAE
jgi:hypothetical protein